MMSICIRTEWKATLLLPFRKPKVPLPAYDLKKNSVYTPREEIKNVSDRMFVTLAFRSGDHMHAIWDIIYLSSKSQKNPVHPRKKRKFEAVGNWCSLIQNQTIRYFRYCSVASRICTQQAMRIRLVN